MQRRPYTTQVQDMPFESRRHIVGSIMVGTGTALLLLCLLCHLLGAKRRQVLKALAFIMLCVGLALLLTGLVFLCPRPGTIARMGETYANNEQAQMGGTNANPQLAIMPNPPGPVISGALPTTSDPAAMHGIHRSASQRYPSHPRRTSSIDTNNVAPRRPSLSGPECKPNAEEPPPAYYNYTTGDHITTIPHDETSSQMRQQNNPRTTKNENV